MFKYFCRCNDAVSDLYDGKSKNKIAVVFFFLIPMAAMVSLQNTVKIGDEEVPINPMTLFSCLVVLVMRENDIAS